MPPSDSDSDEPVVVKKRRVTQVPSSDSDEAVIVKKRTARAVAGTAQLAFSSHSGSDDSADAPGSPGRGRRRKRRRPVRADPLAELRQLIDMAGPEEDTRDRGAAQYYGQESWAGEKPDAAAAEQQDSAGVLHIVYAGASRQLCQPECCELCDGGFRNDVRAAAERRGMRTRSWRVDTLDDWRALRRHVESAGLGRGRGLLCVFMHSWGRPFMRGECVPAWEFYPLLERVAAQHVLMYPAAPPLERLHSEKRYRSRHMPPTEYLRFLRCAGGWAVGRGGGAPPARPLTDAALEEEVGRRVARLAAGAPARLGAPLASVMVKEGLSWNGDHVRRLAPDAAAVATALRRHTLGDAAPAREEVDVMLQAAVPVLAELRWCVFQPAGGAGRAEGKRWLTLNAGPEGGLAGANGRKEKRECYKDLLAAGLIRDEGASLAAFEESFRGVVESVLEEARGDHGGEAPLYTRVDLLVTPSGRAWLGERESWGADVYGVPRTEVAERMVAHGAARLAVPTP